MSKWVGYAVSVNCGEPLGCYQGTIFEADGTTITLTKPFRNGFPYPKSQVTLNAADIKELKIIEQRAERAEQTHSTVAVTKGKKGQRATVCENLQANPTNSGNQAAARSKPIDIQGPRHKPGSHTVLAGSYGTAGSTPKGRALEKARRRHEAFLADPADTALAGDFDFEGNLALFDKQALWEEMRCGSGPGSRPDVVAEAGKLRHDENVLGGAPPADAEGPVRVPGCWRGPVEYVTDAGARVPSVSGAARRRLWRGLAARRLQDPALTLLARAAADVALRLVGGDRRLDPRNAHQVPVVVAVAGAGGAGGAALTAARLLAAHGARACACVPRRADPEALAALRQAGLPVLPPADLPRPDLVLLALHDPAEEDGDGDGDGDEVEEALRWVRAARACVVALEPPAAGWAGVSWRACVLGLLPAALPAGRLYLANLAPPPPLFADLAISYRPPFGACSVLALHPADD